MKNFFLFSAAVLMASLSLPAYAQDYNRIGASYELETWFDDEDNTNLNGFGVHYIHGFRLSKHIPLYLETGLKMSMGFYNETESEYFGHDYDLIYNGRNSIDKVKFSIDVTKLSFSVPFNVAYKVNLRNNLSLLPYCGFNFKVNALAQAKATASIPGYGSDSETYNLLKGEDAANVFQLGWHLGVGFNFNRLYAGLSYGTDFIRFAEDTYSSTFNISVGYNF